MTLDKGKCICDESGKLIFFNELIHQLFPKDLPPEFIFDIDEEISKKDWKNHLKKLKEHSKISLNHDIGPSGNTVNVLSESHLFYAHGKALILFDFQKIHTEIIEASYPDEQQNQTEKNDILDISNSPQLLLLLDENGMILNQSSTFAKEVGIANKKPGSRVSEKFVEYSKTQFKNDIEQVNRGKAFERRLVLKCKGRRFIDGHGTLILIQSDRHSEYLLFFRIIESIDDLQELLDVANEKLKVYQEKQKGQELLSVHQPIEEFNFENIITSSQAYKNILAQVAQVADTDTTVLITGETGTGKELLANALYKLSDRDDQPFIKVNCAVFTKELIESTLFGHEKGAFTGATERKIGYFEKADKGTIFLDEVGELTLDSQVKLLRVLQSGELMRVGGTKTITTDVRVIAATNRNLPKLIAKKEFRQDLYYRLNVFPIYNIPLRERREDIPFLIEHFMRKYSKKMGKKVNQIRKNDAKMLRTYRFPGNIRELENLVERAIILSTDNVIALSKAFSHRKSSELVESKFLTFEEAQKKHIKRAVALCNGKITGKGGAAELLNINGKTLVSKMRKLGIK